MSPAWNTFGRFWEKELHQSVSSDPETAAAAADWVERFSGTITDPPLRKALSRLSCFLRSAHTKRVGVFRRRLLTSREREEQLDVLAVGASRAARKCGN